MEKPYLLFLGDVHDELAAKTAHGIVDWRPDWCVGQVRLPGCKANTKLPDISIEEGAAKGAKTLVVAVVNSGGALPEHWVASIVEAMERGMDVASGLHRRLETFPEIKAAADRLGRQLFNVRHHNEQLNTGKGSKRTGKRALTVGTDCSVGKKYTSLAITKEMEARGLDVSFCATGQTGVFIAERGIAIDAVVADFISGAAEWLSPDADPNHWDIVEGQGSLFHAAFAGVTLGLLHGAQPDALILCHEPTRTHMRGLPHAPIPKLKDCFQPYLQMASLTNPAARFVGISINTHALDRQAADRLLKSTQDEFGLPTVDPIATGVGPIVDKLATI